MNKNKIVYEGWTFQGNDFKDGNMFLATSLLSSQLQVNSFEATVKSADPSIINFERNSKLIYYYDNQQQGIFYVQDIERAGPDTYKISATSTLGLLTEGKHYGGIYTGQTAQEIISDICGTVPFIIKSNLAGTKLYGWLPIAAPRDNLSQVLFAIGAALKTDLDGVLRIAGLWDGVSGSVGKGEMYQGSNVEYAAKVTQVVLTEHQYSEGGDTKKLFEGTAQAGDIITFNAPMYNLSASGFSIQASGANWAKVSGGSGALTGNEYVHNTRLITRDVQTANEPNVKTVDKATLVSLVNSSAVADRLASYFKCKETINADVVYKGENAGNVMTTYHPFDRADVNACLQSADITLSNTMKAQEKSLVGFKPLQGSDVVTIDQHQVITDSRTVRLPEDASQLRIVLIGGGDGGHVGEKGKDGSRGISASASNSSAAIQTNSGNPGNGGAGGGGGTGGTGGRVFQVDIGDNISTPLSISIGRGGGSETAGNATTVTINGVTYSSASGTQSPGGYLDITTGIVYAGTGNSGLSGAAGGKGGQPASDMNGSGLAGSAGSPCGGNSGGSGGSGGRSYSSNKWISIPSGGGGGGAAYNAAGGTGAAGQSRTAGAGGTGATGTTPSAETRPGWGGTGGNGGGGGGGGGGTVAIASNGGSVTVSGGSAGTGGNGGPGGNGAPGCVILYYGVPHKVSAGQLADKNNRMVLDRIGRRIIV